MAIRIGARRAKRRNDSRRSSGDVGQTQAASITSPPAQRTAAERCTQAASAVNQDESTAEWPERESPDSNTSARANAPHRNARFPNHQAMKSIAATQVKPSVIAMNACPNRVPLATGERSP